MKQLLGILLCIGLLGCSTTNNSIHISQQLVFDSIKLRPGVDGFGGSINYTVIADTPHLLYYTASAKCLYTINLLSHAEDSIALHPRHHGQLFFFTLDSAQHLYILPVNAAQNRIYKYADSAAYCYTSPIPTGLSVLAPVSVAFKVYNNTTVLNKADWIDMRTPAGRDSLCSSPILQWCQLGDTSMYSTGHALYYPKEYRTQLYPDHYPICYTSNNQTIYSLFNSSNTLSKYNRANTCLAATSIKGHTPTYSYLNKDSLSLPGYYERIAMHNHKYLAIKADERNHLLYIFVKETEAANTKPGYEPTFEDYPVTAYVFDTLLRQQPQVWHLDNQLKTRIFNCFIYNNILYAADNETRKIYAYRVGS